MFSRKLNWLIAIGAAAIAVAGGAYGIVSATAGSSPGAATTATSTSATSGRPALGGRASNARSGPAAGGAIGTLDSVSGSSFTVSTSAGLKLTVSTASSTTYRAGTGAASASILQTGESVLVLGTVDGTAITASEVVVEPTGASATSARNVVPFQRGAPSRAKQVGQIPADYTQGSGTIVSGTTADQATRAALAVYPGGIIDRVVRLSNGEYEVHNIGVNWPHHVFVSQTFEVVGAD